MAPPLHSLPNKMNHFHYQSMPNYLFPHEQALDSGRNQQSDAFCGTLGDFPLNLVLPNNGDLDCVGCCWTYLVHNRGYSEAVETTRVYYSRAEVSCFVDGPQGRAGRHAVIQTGFDYDLGTIGNRPTQSSRSFQLYYPECYWRSH